VAAQPDINADLARLKRDGMIDMASLK